MKNIFRKYKDSSVKGIYVVGFQKVKDNVLSKCYSSLNNFNYKS